MKYLDLTLPTPEENLALDEALLDLCEDGHEAEMLRFWEPKDYFVVVGYSNRIETEVHLPACRENKIPVLRRPSGGGTVLQGPGCLNYALILKIPDSGPLAHLTKTNDFILDQHRMALEPVLKKKLTVQGTSDLTMEALKFSGNAQRRKKNSLLFHGTFLLNLDFSYVEKFLPLPSRKPAYRAERAHREFLTNLNIEADKIKNALKKIWGAEEKLAEPPLEQMKDLVRTHYSNDLWNFKF